MQEIVIIGIGQTKVKESWDKSIREIAGEAIFSAMLDAGISTADGLFIGNMMSAMTSHQENLGTLIADWIGLQGKEAFKIEAACGSGGAALRMAIFAVSSGEMDIAIASGVEKMSEVPVSEITAALASAADADYEAIHGLSFVALNALIMKRYIHHYQWKHEDFAQFSVNAHTNALSNPYARLHNKVSIEQYQKARMVSDPINLLDASPTGDGAAAVIITSKSKLSKLNISRNPIIKIIGSASATDYLAVHDRINPIWLGAAQKSAKRAYAQAGVTPNEIDFFELHDAFSIMAALSLEACGFADQGEAPRIALNEDITPTGRIPIATMGGLKARGHPVGATGIYQIVETVQQLRGNAGVTQVENAKIGMSQNIGGSGATIITHILKAN
jgi:acetyl-CoA C-acetyltransferase